MKILCSLILACALLFPAPLFAKSTPKVSAKKIVAAKSAVQTTKKSATKKAAPVKKAAPIKKTTPKTVVKKAAAPTVKKPSAQKPPVPPLKQEAAQQPTGAAAVQPYMPEKNGEPPADDTKSKAKELLKKLEEIKRTVPAKPESVKLNPIEKQPLPEQKYWLDQPTQDAPVRDYYKEHPGSYSPPLLKYDLPSGVY